MTKVEMVKILVRQEIQSRRPLVLLACAEEMEAYQLYLIQLKDKYMALPIDQLGGMVKGVERKAG